VRNVRAIEALGRVDVICMDKTGTLTEGRVEVARVSDGETVAEPTSLGQTHREVLVSAMRATLDPRAADSVSDPLDRALLRGAARAGVPRDSYAAERERLSEQAFESGRGFHSVLVRVDGQLVLDVKGSPEVLVEKSARRRRGEKTPKLNAATRKKLLAHAQELARDGLRVLAVARRESPAGTEPLEVCDQGVDGSNGDFGNLTCASVTGNPAMVGRLQCRCCMPLSDMCMMGSGSTGPLGGNGG